MSLDSTIRLNKYISDSGVVSRRKADLLIAAGRVKVNKQVVTDLGTKVQLSDFVTVDGDPISVSHKQIYVLVNKPKDVITSVSDERGRRTILDIVNIRERLFPVGRLDRNTTGALLLTNDGELANRLTHPKYQIKRTYIAKLDRVLSIYDANRIVKGIDIGAGEISLPCEILIDPANKKNVRISLTEGKNHEVKRIFEAAGYEVKSLDRKFFHNLSTRGLARGKYRYLTKQEIIELRKLLT